MENDWQPSASIETLKKRAQLLADVRLFFAKRNVLEIETPILSSAAPTAPYLDSFQTDFIPLGSQEKHTYLSAYQRRNNSAPWTWCIKLIANFLYASRRKN